MAAASEWNDEGQEQWNAEREAEQKHLQDVRKRRRSLQAEIESMKRQYQRDAAPTKKKKPQRTSPATQFLWRKEMEARSAATAAARQELFLAPEKAGRAVGDELWTLTQRDLTEHLDSQTNAKRWSFRDRDGLGPYRCAYASNGRTLAFVSEMGHAAVLNLKKRKLMAETQFRTLVRDITFCHDDRLIVLAEKKYACMYSMQWVELHKMAHHTFPTRLAFLPWHFLICSVNTFGDVVWQDISTGNLAARRNMQEGATHVLTRNPWNSVLVTGHRRGTVQMWSPGVDTYLAKVKVSSSALTGVAIDLLGRNMVTTTANGAVKVWDLRNYKEIHAYRSPTPVVDVKISQTTMVGLAYPNYVEFWKGLLGPEKQEMPYMMHSTKRREITNLEFCPYEDVVGLGLNNGFQSIIIPGVGEPNIDSNLPNPLETAKQKNERPVKMLLDKLPPESIMLDPESIGVVMKSKTDEKLKDLAQRQRKVTKEIIAQWAPEEVLEEPPSEDSEAAPDEMGTVDAQRAGKGPSKRKKRVKQKSIDKKKKNYDWEKVKKAQRQQQQCLDAKQAAAADKPVEEEPVPGGAMDRFFAAWRKQRQASSR
eukprot:GGOE01000364.1.p1 GENE.GGOE01000364.1~~GGOE01000364.1.p1  ORF type:complete len:607 (-),score=197.49 GGOE01000364.1:348-2123(-)